VGRNSPNFDYCTKLHELQIIHNIPVVDGVVLHLNYISSKMFLPGTHTNTLMKTEHHILQSNKSQIYVR